MPQPFPRNLENPQLQIGDASKQRPDLFMRGMAVIAHHSQVDAVLNTAMVHLLGTDPEPGLIMLSAINNNNIKQKAYTELAKNRLSNEDLIIFEGVLAACAAADKERNRLAHDLWATEAQLPKSIVLVSSREFSRIAVRFHMLRNVPDLSEEIGEQLVAAIRASGLVYDRTDFVRIQEQMSHTFFLTVSLSIMLDHTTPDHEVTKQRVQLQSALQKGH